MAKNLFAKMREAGYGNQISEQKTKLWEKGDVVLDSKDLNAKDVEVEVRKSLEYENSIFVIVRQGKESTVFPFVMGEIDADDFEANDKGVISNFDEEIEIVEVTALRDDEELEISKGEKALRAFIAE